MPRLVLKPTQSQEDRWSAPKSIPHRSPPERVVAVKALRKLFMTAAEIAELPGMALTIVSAVLKTDRARQALAALKPNRRTATRGKRP